MLAYFFKLASSLFWTSWSKVHTIWRLSLTCLAPRPMNFVATGHELSWDIQWAGLMVT